MTSTDHGLKIAFLGTRGNVAPKDRRHQMHTSALISNGAGGVMIDCGETWRRAVFELRPDAIVLTHAHPDHSFGLDAGAPCPVWATQETWDRIDHFPIPPNLRHVLSPRHPRQIGGIRFEAFPVVHSIRAPAVGYRIHANRIGMFYVPDVVWIPDRKAAFHRIRVYVGDGATITRNMVRRHRETGELFGHANIRRQLGWCAEEGVRQMMVTHCGSDIVGGDERATTERIRMLARERGVEVEIARDGMKRAYA
ncbi:MAG: MBL fold metallo-hydrolase [Myxococcales bacterium]|jgi:phosphoribosyl 1,2-cyclic phosphodiesterase